MRQIGEIVDELVMELQSKGKIMPMAREMSR